MTSTDAASSPGPAPGPGELPDARELTRLLRSAVRGEVDDGRRRRAEYSSDASNYRVVPRVVVFPRDVDDVLAAAAVARSAGVPLTARGGGTSVAGNAIGPGVVLDTSRHLGRVLELDPEAGTARVEPGAVLDTLQAAARPHGLRFGPDPSTHARCTVGGMIGNNACGPHAVAYGRTSDNVLELDVVDGTGRRFTAGRADRGPAAVPGLERLVAEGMATIRTECGRFGRQGSGYALEHLLPEHGGDLAKALVGSEGTCALVLGATLRLVPAAPATALAVLGYPDMPTAADAAHALLPHRPLAVEGVDARLVASVRSARRGTASGGVPELPPGGGWLFVEMGGETPAAALAAARALAADAGTTAVMVEPAGPKAAALWRIREDGAGLAGRSPTGKPAWPGWEDAAVPPEHLGAYLRDFEALTTAHGIDGVPYGHFGDGCVHVRLDLPLEDRPQRLRPFLAEAAALVARYGGSLSGEHGDGRARGELLPAVYSAEAITLFDRFKGLFDPDDLLNPGVLVRPRPVDADLRRPAARPLPLTRRPGGRALAEDGGDLSRAAHRCVGVGKCRADLTASGGFMCPSYLATRDERESTRGRARVLQEMANGTLVGGGYRAPELRESLDLCLACRACATDCPAGVDMAAYKSEVLHHAYRRRLRPLSHYSLGRLPLWTRAVSRLPGLPRLVNGLLRPRAVRRLVLRAGGMDARRALPAFAAEPFRRWARSRAVQGPDDNANDRPPVVLWADTFTDAFTPEAGRAAVRLLEDAGYRVLIPAGRACCGLTWISTGQLDAARRRLRGTLDALAPFAAAGLPIVGLEPSCTAVLRRDLVELLPDDPRSRRLADHVSTLAELLGRPLPDGSRWRPPSLAGVRVVAQPHCHQHAVMGYAADAALLRAAGAEVETTAGCCGLAGDFGMERGHYEVSRAVAENALLPALRARPDAVLLADGFSCRTQAAQLAGREGVHLAQLLADPPRGRAD